MDEATKIHLLSYELIPIIDDIEPETKAVVMNHIATCESCQTLYASAYELDYAFPLLEKNDELVEVQPLKKLVQFNQGIKLLLIMIRVAILSYIFYSGIAYSSVVTNPDIYHYIQSSLYLFYLPAVLFLNVFTFVFLNKKWLIYSLVADVTIIFVLGFIFKLFIL